MFLSLVGAVEAIMPATSPKAVAKKQKKSMHRRRRERAQKFMVKASVKKAVKAKTEELEKQIEELRGRANTHMRARARVMRCMFLTGSGDPKWYKNGFRGLQNTWYKMVFKWSSNCLYGRSKVAGRAQTI